VIDFALGDERETVIQLLRRVCPFLAQEGADPKQIDLTQIEYLGPFAVAILFANSQAERLAGHSHEILLPIERPKVMGFARFSGLHHRLDGGPAPDVSHPDNQTVPLEIVQKATWKVANPVIELVRRHVVISDDDETYLRNSVTEVIQNVEDHAESAIGAVYCARFLKKPRKIRVAIVDRGLGIGTTLIRKHPEIRSTEVALRRVVDGGISARSKPNNLGLGISNLWRQITQQLGGEIFIVTEGAIGYSDHTGHLCTSNVGAHFAGTGVFFTVPVVDKENDRARNN